jgi:hypothetical protein
LQRGLRVGKDGVALVGLVSLAELHNRLINGVDLAIENLLVFA